MALYVLPSGPKRPHICSNLGSYLADIAEGYTSATQTCHKEEVKARIANDMRQTRYT